MVLGIETYIALRDIYAAEPEEIREVWRWACKAMRSQQRRRIESPLVLHRFLHERADP